MENRWTSLWKSSTHSAVCELLQCRAKTQAAISDQTGAEQFGAVAGKGSGKPAGEVGPMLTSRRGPAGGGLWTTTGMFRWIVLWTSLAISVDKL